MMRRRERLARRWRRVMRVAPVRKMREGQGRVLGAGLVGVGGAAAMCGAAGGVGIGAFGSGVVERGVGEGSGDMG